MLDALSKATFSSLAGSVLLKRLASRYGMRRPYGFARRFVAGETLEELIAVVRDIEARGLLTTVDHLGERVVERASVLAATREYGEIVEALAAAGVGRNLSVKLSQVGLDIDRATCIDNLRRILDIAAASETFVRLDMEDSSYVDDTLLTFEALWNIGYTNMGLVIQSALRRSPDDLTRVLALGARIRLVKGAYSEPRDVAFQKKEEVDAAFVSLMQRLLDDGRYHAIATHDPAMIDATKAYAASRGLARSAFEFQMLYGIRRDLQRALAAEGYPFRVYVPFGREWFPYFMRRLGERPANVSFVLKSLLRERPDEDA